MIPCLIAVDQPKYAVFLGTPNPAVSEYLNGLDRLIDNSWFVSGLRILNELQFSEKWLSLFVSQASSKINYWFMLS